MKKIISVCVITYNHAPYLRQCLDSILAQQVGVPFEVVIRDDGSRDTTPAIVAEYAARHPGVVRALPVERNIGANANLLTTFAAAEGDYIAVCEGDDFWTDRAKLAKQLACAERLAAVDFFTHPASTGSGDEAHARAWPCQHKPSFDARDILLGFGQFAPTASYFFRRCAVANLPAWFAKAPVGDFFMELYLTGNKLGHGLDEVMSQYRTASIGSWDDGIRNDATGEKGVRAYRMIKIYLRKSIRDFPGLEAAFAKRIEYVNFAIAHQYMKVGQHAKFRLYMDKAGGGVASIGRNAALLYRFRASRSLITSLYYVRKAIGHAKAVF
jgi:glycosyltransferase involved in cell wall biosynthesis